MNITIGNILSKNLFFCHRFNFGKLPFCRNAALKSPPVLGGVQSPFEGGPKGGGCYSAGWLLFQQTFFAIKLFFQLIFVCFWVLAPTNLRTTPAYRPPLLGKEGSLGTMDFLGGMYYFLLSH